MYLVRGFRPHALGSPAGQASLLLCVRAEPCWPMLLLDALHASPPLPPPLAAVPSDPTVMASAVIIAYYHDYMSHYCLSLRDITYDYMFFITS